jgi:NAD+ diphosphatase
MLDRIAERRTDETWVAAELKRPSNQVVWIDHGKCATLDGVHLRLDSVAEVPVGTETTLLGQREGITYFAAHLSEGDPDWRWHGLRELGALRDNVDIALTAIALDNWRRTHTHCPRCGEHTYDTDAGWSRQCPHDGSRHFPRTDPAIIVLVIDESDRALLGRQVRWPVGWFSTLAGFVEPGESAEEALRREVFEEAGIITGTDPHDVRYCMSQPWPFPGSLMLGFHASAVSTDIQVDGDEIAEAHWFSRAELAAACSDRSVLLPPGISVARALIERWYGSALPGDWLR